MTFNLLVATVGRPTLQRLLDSLSPQLEEQDCLTLVFDGHSSHPPVNLSAFKCKITMYCEPVALGYWGHGIRNKYASLLEKKDFVMHGDDDDTYFPGALKALREQCNNTEALYIARMMHHTCVLPSGDEIRTGNIGTPCGIIPYELNKQGTWQMEHGGDGRFYEELARLKPTIVYLKTIIYNIRCSVRVQ